MRLGSRVLASMNITRSSLVPTATVLASIHICNVQSIQITWTFIFSGSTKNTHTALNVNIMQVTLLALSSRSGLESLQTHRVQFLHGSTTGKHAEGGMHSRMRTLCHTAAIISKGPGTLPAPPGSSGPKRIARRLPQRFCVATHQSSLPIYSRIINRMRSSSADIS